MSKPRTHAGRRLHDNWARHGLLPAGDWTSREVMQAAIPIIEAEAAALTIERLVDEAEASGKPAIVKWVEGILPRLDGLTRVG